MSTVDSRNNPEGYPSGEKPQRYRIREAFSDEWSRRYEIRGSKRPQYTLGNIVERVTRVSADSVNHMFYHALQEEDQLFADLCSFTIQDACRYFYAEDWEPLTGVDDIVMTDAEVAESIRRLDLGENKREADRMGKPRYVLADLPWDQQRALVERLYALRREFGFEKLGPVQGEEVNP